MFDKHRHIFLVAICFALVSCGSDDEKPVDLDNNGAVNNGGPNNGGLNNGVNNGGNNGGTLTGTEVVAGQTFASDTTVKFSRYGIGFDVPSPFEGSVEGDFFILSRSSSSGILIIGALRGSLQDAQATLAGPVDLGDGFISTPNGDPATEGNVVSVETSVSNGQQMFGGAVRTIIGPHDVNLFLFSVAPPNELSQIEEGADAVQASLVFAEPDVPEPGTTGGDWKAVLDGKKVTRFFTATDYFEEESYFYCADGTYSRTFTSTAGSVSETGQWSVEGELTGGVLTVFSQDGTTREFSPIVFSSDVKFTVNGTDWFLEDGGC